MGSIGGTEGLVGSATTTCAELLQELNIRGTWSGFAFVCKATTTSGRQQVLHVHNQLTTSTFYQDHDSLLVATTVYSLQLQLLSLSLFDHVLRPDLHVLINLFID